MRLIDEEQVPLERRAFHPQFPFWQVRKCPARRAKETLSRAPWSESPDWHPEPIFLPTMLQGSFGRIARRCDSGVAPGVRGSALECEVPTATERVIVGPEQVSWIRAHDDTCKNGPEPLRCRIRMTRERTHVIIYRKYPRPSYASRVYTQQPQISRALPGSRFQSRLAASARQERYQAGWSGKSPGIQRPANAAAKTRRSGARGLSEPITPAFTRSATMRRA